MARITVEDCLAHEQNRFALVILATRRAKQLLGGAPTVTDTRDHKNVVAALREIADEEVAAEEERERLLKEQREREEMARTATATDSLSSVFGDSPSSASENGSEDSSDSSSDEEE